MTAPVNAVGATPAAVTAPTLGVISVALNNNWVICCYCDRP
jgi:hypothetical protein